MEAVKPLTTSRVRCICWIDTVDILCDDMDDTLDDMFDHIQMVAFNGLNVVKVIDFVTFEPIIFILKA